MEFLFKVKLLLEVDVKVLLEVKVHWDLVLNVLHNVEVLLETKACLWFEGGGEVRWVSLFVMEEKDLREEGLQGELLKSNRTKETQGGADCLKRNFLLAMLVPLPLFCSFSPPQQHLLVLVHQQPVANQR